MFKKNMKNKIKVVNVKCSGCAKTVTSELEKIWIKDIEVWFTEKDSVNERVIKFEWDLEKAKIRLTELWYPEVWSDEANSLLKKAKSFVSCAVWKMK